MLKRLPLGRVLKVLAGSTALLALGLVSPPAEAAIPAVFTNTAAPIPCAVQSGFRVCDQTVAGNPGGAARSTVKTFDGVPLDVRVAFPADSGGADTGYPLVMLFNGLGTPKQDINSMTPFLQRGYATMSFATRGISESCGTPASRSADPSGCANGYVRLMDTRYEVRDAQQLAGLLADEGRTSYTQIGATGLSYGGGLAMALAALKDRQMLPNGSLVPWTSPIAGAPMRIAAATPEIPWTDFMAILLPNGSTLDYVADAPYVGRSGVLKQSIWNFVYGSAASGFLASPGADPDADLQNWNTTFNNGEPYDDASGHPLAPMADIRDELTTHHSSYYIASSEAPAPVLISNGFTDDLTPADEAIRFFNRTRTLYPTADISLFLGNFGHQRAPLNAGNPAAAAETAWMDYYVKGVGSLPFHGVQAQRQACPSGGGAATSSGSWASAAPGEVRLDDATQKTILPTAGSAAINANFEPFSGGGACATSDATDQADTATYRSDPLPGVYTLLGSPTVIASITSPGSDSQIAARLFDVNPSTNTQTLVARGLWRPAITSTPTQQIFQLHPNDYSFATGHVAKLELLPNDAGSSPGASYGRASNGQQNVTVEGLELRLPVRQAPGSLGGLVQAPAPKVVPPGYALARDFITGYPRPIAATPLRVPLVPAFEACTSPDELHGPPLAFGSCSSPAQVSDQVTVGTSDANGQMPNSIGFVRLSVLSDDQSTSADEGDVRVKASVTDVRSRADLSDYIGELQETGSVRITDRANGTSGSDAATTQDLPFPVTVPCTATADTTVGAACSVTTTFNAVMPGAVASGKRAVWELDQIEMRDGGPDGDAETEPNAVFARQGLFVR